MKNDYKEINFVDKDINSDWIFGRGPNMTRMISQSGRSMVEMLGVLAVIGVLSIGGIAGYSYGMNKYRANETINDVNLRAMDVISQLTRGNTPNLASWLTTSTAGYPISLVSDENTLNYYIRVEKVPHEVCEIISEAMPESVEILVDNENEKCAPGENVMDFAYAGFDEAQGENNGNTGICPAGTSAEGLGGYAGASDADGNRCYCENADTKWDGSTCLKADGECSSFADCGYRFQFCNFNATCVNGETEGVRYEGWCEDFFEDGGEKYGDYFMYNGLYNWFTAQDLCAFLGMQMVSLEDLGCGGYGEKCMSDTLLALKESPYYPVPFWTTDFYEENNTCDAVTIDENDRIYGEEISGEAGVICRKK